MVKDKRKPARKKPKPKKPKLVWTVSQTDTEIMFRVSLK